MTNTLQTHKNHYAIIMAGGVGSRFWPMSTENFPKQFHDMLGSGETLIQKTFNRLHKTIPVENIFILTNEKYQDLVLQQLPKIKKQQVVLEPAMRNTAPCILYAALKIQKENPDAVMVVAPSDHWIEDEDAFSNNLQTCFRKCERSDILMTLGITPTFANTGYGYIQFKESEAEIKKVVQFTEKPNKENAKTFLASGNYLWNAGIFIWSVKSIVAAFKEFQSELYKLFYKGIDAYNTVAEAFFIEQNYAKATDISIDYAIMENAKNVYVLPATFDWNDLGTWGALYEKLEKDNKKNAVVRANTLLVNAKNNMISTHQQKKLVVIDGLNDYIIVDKDDVLLIYPKSKEQDIKQLRAVVKDTFGNKLV